MKYRVLPIINAVGCLALTALVAVQWLKERTLNDDLHGLQTRLTEVRKEAADQAARRAALERDIAVLKEAITATQQAAESSARDLAEQEQIATGLKDDLATAGEQLTAWEQAVATRDERIRTLESELAATRQRLDEAIQRLKQAGAR